MADFVVNDEFACLGEEFVERRRWQTHVPNNRPGLPL
jgi:hypothetical protein